MSKIYYRFLDDMIDPASGEVVAERGDHVKGSRDLSARIAALLNEYPNQWSITKVANYVNIADPTKELGPTDILDSLQRALANRNREKDQKSVLLWVDWLLRDARWLLERVSNG